jgi:uncharacterized protein (DUF1697 family)
MTGHNSIKMTDLSLLFTKLGFRENKTYIQSGNVIFKAADNLTEQEIEKMIENGISRKYGYTVPAIVRSIDDLKNLTSVNPYLAEPGFDPSKMAVIFLTDNITENQAVKMININYPPDKYQLSNREIFTFCPNGFGKTKLYTNFFENRMGVTGTARNWKTVTTLLKMAE